VPTVEIEHATGSTDVLLRFDSGPDYLISELTGVQFMPGPEFTLYGDGTVIFRNDRAEPPPAEGPIFRAHPFMVAYLDEGQIQAVLQFALFEGELRTALERYETTEVDGAGYSLFFVRADGIDKRVEVVSSGAFNVLADRLRDFGRDGRLPTQVWAPDRSWGVLFEAGAWIEAGGLMPAEVPDTGGAPWPWPDLAPEAFAYRNDRYYVLDEQPADPNAPGDRRRVMSAAEAAVLGLSDNGGVVQGIYVLGPDRRTLYWFSLWPMLPDETD
jgi:hypothetical protein